jgi:hypothetical protein
MNARWLFVMVLLACAACYDAADRQPVRQPNRLRDNQQGTEPEDPPTTTAHATSGNGRGGENRPPHR